MKLLLSKNDLISIISKLQTVVSAKPAIPVLSYILLEAQDDQLVISATDLTISMLAWVPAKVVEPGSVALPARRFFQLIRELSAPQVEIHVEPGLSVTINSGSSHFKIQGINKEEFPLLPTLDSERVFTVPSNRLREMLARTLFAAARDDSRQELNGILFEQSSNKATFVGTDGKRLAKLQTEVSTFPEENNSYILPFKGAEEMMKLLEDKETPADLYLLSDKIALKLDSALFITKLISGKYPDVSQVIPRKQQQPLLLHRDELISLLRQISLFTSETANSVRFTFTQGELHLAIQNSEVGEGKASMPVNYSGPKLDIAFNPHYFLELLRHTKDETVELSLTDAFNPGLITDSTSAQFVIMPMRCDAK